VEKKANGPTVPYGSAHTESPEPRTRLEKEHEPGKFPFYVLQGRKPDTPQAGGVSVTLNACNADWGKILAPRDFRPRIAALHLSDASPRPVLCPTPVPDPSTAPPPPPEARQALLRLSGRGRQGPWAVLALRHPDAGSDTTGI